MIEDCRRQVTGGIVTGLQIFEQAVIPFLLGNSECWFNINKKTMDELTSLQLLFYRQLFAIGSGAPIPLFYWDTAGLLMELRIIQKKLIFLHHVATLPEDSLAREIYELQRQLSLPGLVSECSEYLVKFDVTDITQYTKSQWKNKINSLIQEENRAELLKRMEKYKKLKSDSLREEKYELKPYLKSLNLSQSRLRYKIRAEMIPTVQMNFQSDRKFTHNIWKCECGHMDSQTHLQNFCPLYDDIRKGKDMSNDEDIVDFFRQVIARRKEDDAILRQSPMGRLHMMMNNVELLGLPVSGSGRHIPVVWCPLQWYLQTESSYSYLYYHSIVDRFTYIHTYIDLNSHVLLCRNHISMYQMVRDI